MIDAASGETQLLLIAPLWKTKARRACDYGIVTPTVSQQNHFLNRDKERIISIFVARRLREIELSVRIFIIVENFSVVSIDGIEREAARQTQS